MEILESEICDDIQENVVRAERNIEYIKDKITELEEYKLQGAMVRSRAKWDLEGEKPSKYFFSLERRNYLAKCISKLETSGNTELSESKEIMCELQRFYSVLYTEEEERLFSFENTTTRFLKDNQIIELDSEITLNEVKCAVFSMKDNKAPGCDGLPIEFYKLHWEVLKDWLLDLFKYCYDMHILNPSARKGIISLLPKGDKNPFLLKNWRPLTLLNLDYKIIAKLLAARIKKTLHDIIDVQQTGFMEKRQISENIRKTMDIVAYANEKKKRWVIISVDFEKCFDRICYEGIYGALKYFKYGQIFSNWCHLFYNEFLVCVQNRGFISPFFKKSRSVNQGCPISPYLFLLCSEIMAHKIYQNVNGVTVEGIKQVMSQFADDTVIFIEFDQREIDGVMEVLASLETQLGLKISYEKTTLYRIGSLKNSEATLYTQKKVNWSDGDIDLLGVTIKNAGGAAIDMAQFRKPISKLQKITNIWSGRKLTLMGRVLIVNTLLMPLFVYSLSVTQLLCNSYYAEVESSIKKFVWNSKKCKISHDILHRNKKQGGLHLINLNWKHRALVLQWVYKIASSRTFNYVYNWLNLGLEENIWLININEKDIDKYITVDSYWKHVLKLWAKYHFTSVLEGLESLDEIIWLNSNIRADNKPLFSKSCINAGIIKLKDIVDETTYEFKTYDNIVLEFGSCLSWLEYAQIRAAVPCTFVKGLKLSRFVNIETRLELYDDKIKKNPVRELYAYIENSESKRGYLARPLSMYIQNVEYVLENDFINLFVKLYYITKNTKLRNFQYRLLLGRIFLNDKLFKWKILASDKCDFCNYKQTIKHLFWECVSVVPLITFLFHVIGNFTYTVFINNQFSDRKYDVNNKVFIVHKIFHLQM